ncbi:ABC transporter permease [Biomaibacter acetigenes]|uniref:ABC transporter permease n=1 Tax=Biomaibacter acetigenes TaxID=2316383 RepID=A0A3G2R4D7_9FIRM|nr:ABC transporter permease [Biomaibacter acetigenes]AYO29787.1 ABC transporter permease [Biomaibacter acetigenes]
MIELNKKNVPSQELEFDEEMELQGTTFIREVWYRFRRNKMAMVGAITIILLIFVAVFAPWVAPYDPYKVDLKEQFIAPGAKYFLGTDMYGRDVLSRVIFGTRISLIIGLVPSIISMVLGSVLGIISGYYGGKVDTAIMRVADMVMAFPSLLLAMAVMYTLGANLYNIFIALSIVGWAGTARVVRAQTLSIKEKEFVEAARAIGVKNWIIMIRHIFPNCVAPLLVLLTLGIPEAIMSEASLSFLGVGAQPPTPSWGLMISNGKEYLFSAPWVAISPGFAILIIVLAFNFLGDGLRDALDPFMKQ